MKLVIFLLVCSSLAQLTVPDGGIQQATGGASSTLFTGSTISTQSTQPGASTAQQTTAPPVSGTTTSPTTNPATTTPSPTCNGDGTTEINFDFKGLLAGAKGGDCNCAQKQQCSQCAYGIFGYPCIADPCDQCPCGGGLANPPGSQCIPCTDGSQCSDGTTPSTCLTGAGGVCEPNVEILKKSWFSRDSSSEGSGFFLELTYYIQGPLCHFHVQWASSFPIEQVRLFALAHQFGTAQGNNDPGAACNDDIRYKNVNGVDTNYNIVDNSLQYDPRYNTNGVSGLVYGAGQVGSSLWFGQSSVGTNFRDASMQCPSSVTGGTLPASFKLVVLANQIVPSTFNNLLTNLTAPNPDNIGTHWILIPDRGLCVGSPAFAIQNDGNWIKYGQTPPTCKLGCISAQGPPIFANPGSIFKRDAPAHSESVKPISLLDAEKLFGPRFG